MAALYASSLVKVVRLLYRSKYANELTWSAHL